MTSERTDLQVLARALLGQQMNFNLQRTLVLGVLNALVAMFLFHFLDRLRETI